MSGLQLSQELHSSDNSFQKETIAHIVNGHKKKL